LVIPLNVTKIEGIAFRDCSGLVEMVFEGVPKIESEAFENGARLRRPSLHTGSGAFAGVTAIARLELISCFPIREDLSRALSGCLAADARPVITALLGHQFEQFTIVGA
jgi:hypothetical protein